MALTGKIDFRKSWFGNLILEVEEDVKPLFKRKLQRRWRRAKLMDLAQPEIRPLMDMRLQRYVIPRPKLADKPVSAAPQAAEFCPMPSEASHANKRVTH